MPSSRRDKLKRKHTAIAKAILRCQGWTLELHELFKEPHPDYAEGYNTILIMLEQTLAFINKMKSFI